jgi:multiple sugar transport system substrate-binding protein
MRKMTRVVAAVAAAVAALMTAGCTASGSDDGVTTLQMWGRSDNEAFLPDLVDAFNRNHKDVQIDLALIPSAQVAQKFSAAASGGEGPDLVSLDIATVPQYADAGWLQDITDKAGDLDYRDQLSPSHIELATLDDSLYALPFTADVSVLYYNKTLFERAGLDPETPPTTWVEVREAADAITALGDGSTGYYFSGACGGCMAFTLLPYVWADGGEVLTDNGDAVAATIESNDSLKGTLELFRDMWAGGDVAAQSTTDSGADQFGPFFSGTTGMFVNGSYPLGTLKSEHPDIDFGVTVVPGSSAGAGAAYTGGDSIAITNTASDAEAAWEALEWFTSDGQSELAAAGVLPTRLDIADTEYAQADPRNAVFAEALRVGHTPNSLAVAELFFDNNGPWSALMQRAIFDGDIDGAMTDAQSAMEEVLAD